MRRSQSIPLFARRVHEDGIAAGFDLASTAEFGVDCNFPVIVPLHFLNPDMRRPIVPVWINGIAPPMPLAKRCFCARRDMVRESVATWSSEELRVAVVASGSISKGTSAGLGPSIISQAAAADGAWMSEVLGYLAHGRGGRGSWNAATAERMAASRERLGQNFRIGSPSLASWVTGRRPFWRPSSTTVFAYGAWRLDG